MLSSEILKERHLNVQKEDIVTGAKAVHHFISVRENVNLQRKIMFPSVPG